MTMAPGGFRLSPTAAHKAMCRAMQSAGVDIESGDAILETYLLSLICFFKGLKDEGRSEAEINRFVDWLAENIRTNVNPPADPKGTKPS